MQTQLDFHSPEPYDVLPESWGIWFTQGYSCQRDMVLTAQQLKYQLKNQGISQPIHIIASHEKQRPEITGGADIALVEPKQDKIDWVLQQAEQYQVKIIFAGQNTKQFIQAKQRFVEKGIILLAGVNDLEKLEQINDKAQFTALCEQHEIAVVPATTVYNAEQMRTAYQAWAEQGKVCVKPTHGVFASGFWILDPKSHAFSAFANSQNFRTHPDVFIESYASLPEPPAYLVMPFLDGLECSVDMFCVQGEVISAIARYKHQGDYQSLHQDDPAIDLAKQVVKLFECDGLINMQARYNQQQELYILEINARPSGGIAYTFASGVNIVQQAICHHLDLPYQADYQTGIIVRAVQFPIIV